MLTGASRPASARVFDLFPFNFELDALEMRLYELNETVDYFVILESMRNHRGIRKHLGFARNKERFAAFSHKILHFVLDDSDLWQSSQAAKNQDKTNFWDIDLRQHPTLPKKLQQVLGEFQDSDIVISMSVCNFLSSMSVCANSLHRNSRLSFGERLVIAVHIGCLDQGDKPGVSGIFQLDSKQCIVGVAYFVPCSKVMMQAELRLPLHSSRLHFASWTRRCFPLI